jgi:phage tail P2-like protein
MADFFVHIDEVVHISDERTATKVTNASIAESIAISEGQVQHYDHSVSESVAISDAFEAERTPHTHFEDVIDEVVITDAYDAERVRRSIDDLGGALLYRSHEKFERAAADLEAGILFDLNAELIIDTWNPYKTFLRNLPFLAWAYDVDMWEEGWSENTKREWVSRQFEFKRIRGSIGAMEMILEIAGRDYVGIGGYILRQSLTPPQNFYFSPGLSVEEHNAWLRLMPQIRIFLGSEIGQAKADWFWDDGIWEPDGEGTKDAWAFDNGPELYGRKAVLRRRNEPDLNLRVIEHEEISETYQAVDWEEIRVPGRSQSGFFWGHDYWGSTPATIEEDLAAFWSSAETDPKTFNVNLNRAFDRFSTQLHMSTIKPTLRPINVTYERNSDIKPANSRFCWDHSFWGGLDFLMRDDAPLMLADFLYLYDPNVATPMTLGMSFWDHDRWSFPRHTFELMIDLQQKMSGSEGWWGVNYWEDFYWLPTDLEHVDRACRAVVAAKSLRDKALVQFDPWRPVRSADPLTPETTAADWVPNTL